MTQDREPESIEDVLGRVEEAAQGERRIRVSGIIDKIGEGAFAPLMLVPALFMVSPATAIFGVATICGLIITIIGGQMLVGQEKLWLPDWILRREIAADKVERFVAFLSAPARAVDGLTRPRLSFLVEPPFERVWAGLCVLLALFVPVFELVPMSATIIGASISLFCLAMLARDGLLAVAGLAILAMAVWLVWNVAT